MRARGTLSPSMACIACGALLLVGSVVAWLGSFFAEMADVSWSWWRWHEAALHASFALVSVGIAVRLRSPLLSVAIGFALAQAITVANAEAIDMSQALSVSHAWRVMSWAVMTSVVVAGFALWRARRRAMTKQPRRPTSAYRASAAERSERAPDAPSAFLLASATGLWAGVALVASLVRVDEALPR